VSRTSARPDISGIGDILDNGGESGRVVDRRSPSILFTPEHAMTALSNLSASPKTRTLAAFVMLRYAASTSPPCGTGEDETKVLERTSEDKRNGEYDPPCVPTRSSRRRGRTSSACSTWLFRKLARRSLRWQALPWRRGRPGAGMAQNPGCCGRPLCWLTNKSPEPYGSEFSSKVLGTERPCDWPKYTACADVSPCLFMV